jgi:hypothetical protein
MGLPVGFPEEEKSLERDTVSSPECYGKLRHLEIQALTHARHRLFLFPRLRLVDERWWVLWHITSLAKDSAEDGPAAEDTSECQVWFLDPARPEGRSLLTVQDAECIGGKRHDLNKERYTPKPDYLV